MKLIKILLIMILASVSASAEPINPNRNIALNGMRQSISVLALKLKYIITRQNAKVCGNVAAT